MHFMSVNEFSLIRTAVTFRYKNSVFLSLSLSVFLLAKILYTETANENEERINRWIAFIAFYGKCRVFVCVCVCFVCSKRALWCCLKATVQCQRQFKQNENIWRQQQQPMRIMSAEAHEMRSEILSFENVVWIIIIIITIIIRVEMLYFIFLKRNR